MSFYPTVDPAADSLVWNFGDGQFARDWILENKAGAPSFKATRRRERRSSTARTRSPLAGLVTWRAVAKDGPLLLNLETYQAAIGGKPLDLTYMEYELLKFLASHPGKVFTRETLLSRVWGYEYYGGARTVDVHVRRLRAKLGEEHAGLIQTVRSVGYRFGQSRWMG